MRNSKINRVRETTTAGAREKTIAIASVIVLIGMVFVVFWPALGAQFLNYDDNDYVYQNAHVTNGLTLDGIRWAFIHFHASNWHPLTTISHMLDCQLYGLQPWGHHLTNILLHALAAVLLFWALRALTQNSRSTVRDRRYNIWLCAFVTALFAIHPLRVESVAWVSERKDVLSGVFFMLTLLAYVRYVRSPVGAARGAYLATVVLFALGLMCKPTLVTLPFVLLLLDYWPLERMRSAKCEVRSADEAAPPAGFQYFSVSGFRSLVVEKIPLFILSTISCLITIAAQKEAFTAMQQLPFQQRFANAAVSYVMYLAQSIWPEKLAVLYPYPIAGIDAITVLLALLALWAVTIACYLRRRRNPFLIVGWLWFLGMLVPMIGLVQVGSQPRADRYTYLPAIGLYIGVTWGAAAIATRWPRIAILKPIAIVILTLFAVRSYFETQYWHDTETLWRRAVAVTNNNYAAEDSLANALFEQGKLTDAIAHYRVSLAINPDYPPVHSNLGNALLRQGDVDEAILHLRKAIEVNPSYAEAYNNLASAYMKKGNFPEAINGYEKAIQFKPNYAEAYNNLGVAHLQQGSIDAAIAQYKKAVEITPDSADIQYNLGNAYARKSEWNDAITAYQNAVRIRPNSPKSHNNLGVALKAVGKLDQAREQFADALEINPDYPEAHCNLAAILAVQGHRDEATMHLSEAIRLRPDYEEAKQQLDELMGSK